MKFSSVQVYLAKVNYNARIHNKNCKLAREPRRNQKKKNNNLS